ncbi:MAG: tetratricopeptide repeat protein [Anaerolineae bacterium]
MRIKIDPRWLVILPALIVFLVYLPALGYGFVWDDTIFLVDLPLYRDPALWPQALRQPFALSPNYFRPLALLTFIAELRLGGLNPALFHLTNLLLHALNTALVAALARHLWRSDVDEAQSVGALHATPLQVGAALLYGLHPALLEGVAFISSRFDLLLTTFLLLALLADVSLRHRAARPLGVALAFLLAALAKEMAVALAFVLPLWRLARAPRRFFPLSQFWQKAKKGMAEKVALEGSQRVRDPRPEPGHGPGTSRVGGLITYAAVLLAGCLYLVIRYATLGYLLLAQPGRSIPTGSPLQHLLLVGSSLAEYARLILWPFTTLTPIHYSPLPIPTGDLASWASLVAALVLLAGLVKLVQVAPRSGWLAAAGVVSLLPVINVLPLELGGGAFMAERFLLFPMALFSLAAAPLLCPLTKNSRLGSHNQSPGGVGAASAGVGAASAGLGRGLGNVLQRALPLLWLVVSVTTIQVTLRHWRDDLTLWTWTARRAPHSPIPSTNLALEYINQGNYLAGLETAQHALDLDPTHGDAWNNAGLALTHLERYAEAQDAFERAIDLEPQNALFWNNLAAALREQGQLQEAERVMLDQALRLDPTLPVAHLNLGILYLRADRPDLAAAHLQEALRLLPPDQAAQAQDFLAQAEEPARWLQLGDLLLAHGDPEGALRAFEQAGALGAHPADVAAGQSAALIELNAWPQAEAVLQEALRQAPDDARLYNNLGVIVREQGDLDAAREYFNRAATLAPEWDLPRQNLADLESRLPGATPQP